MRSGKARHRFELQEQADGEDSAGQKNGEWTTIGRFMGSLETLSGGELENARQTVNEATVRIVTRGAPSILLSADATKRLKLRSRVFFIGHVDDVDGKGREIVLLCGERR